MKIDLTQPITDMHKYVESGWAKCLENMGVPHVYYRKDRYAMFGGKYERFYARLSRCDQYIYLYGGRIYLNPSMLREGFIESIVTSEVYDTLYEFYGDDFSITLYNKDDRDIIELDVTVRLTDYTDMNIELITKSYYSHVRLVTEAAKKIGLDVASDPEVDKVLGATNT